MLSLALAQGLLDRNPASHAIMWVALLMGALVAVIVTVEVLDWIRDTAANRRAGVIEAETRADGIRVHPSDTELRGRYADDPGSVSREQRANEPTRHREASRAEWREGR